MLPNLLPKNDFFVGNAGNKWKFQFNNFKCHFVCQTRKDEKSNLKFTSPKIEKILPVLAS